MGCLALFWKNSLKIEVTSSLPNHIDVVVGESLENKWRLTSIYGFADPAKKCDTWALLRHLHASFSMPWLCVEDFNKILRNYKKCGLGPRSATPMKAFREVLDEAGLKDLGYVGRKFTWKGRHQGGFVLEHLDRAIANNQWLSQNPTTKVQHLHSNSSDHQAIIVKPEGISPNPKQTFKFEQVWLQDRGCNDTITSAWGPSIIGAIMPEVAGKVQACGEKLTEWSKNSFGSVRKMLEEKRKLLSRAELDATKGVIK